MATFHYSQKEKVTMWQEHLFSVEAESQIEADKLVKESLKSGSYGGFNYYQTMDLQNTLEPIERDNSILSFSGTTEETFRVKVTGSVAEGFNVTESHLINSKHLEL